MNKPSLPRPGGGVAGNPDRPYPDLWPFALRIYGAPGVEAACLRLQDRAGLDVPMLLFCAWAGLIGPGRLGPAALRAALGRARDWGTVTTALREARRALKRDELGADEARLDLRQAVAVAEQRAERLVLEALEAAGQAVPRADPGGEAVAANFAAYRDAAGYAPSPEVARDLQAIADAAAVVAAGQRPIRP